VGAWKPVLAVALNASQSVAFARACTLPSVVLPKVL